MKMEQLCKTIKDSGMTMTAIARISGINRVTLYNRLNGVGEFTISEALALTKTLHLCQRERDEIFFS